MRKIIIVDGLNLLFRMFYGIPNSIKNSKGKEIKGVIGFIGSIKKYINLFRPYSIIVVFDSETSYIHNKKINNSYKTNRKSYYDVPESENPFSQLNGIKKALDFLKISNLEINNNEADDFIASLTTQRRKYEYIIISTDRDYIQLINKKVLWYNPTSKQTKIYNKEEIEKKYGVSPKQYVEYRSLVGDPSDNIKGIKGIGPKTASNILKHKTVNLYLKNSSNLKLKKVIMDYKNIIQKNKELISLNKKININSMIFNKMNYNLIILNTNEIIKYIKED